MDGKSAQNAQKKRHKERTQVLAGMTVSALTRKTAEQKDSERAERRRGGCGVFEEEIKNVIILIYLGILAGMDVKKRQISLVLTGVLFLSGIGWQILVEQTSWPEWLLSLLPGAGFLLLGYVSREQVGYGDGLLLLTVGIWLGFGQTFGIVTLGLVFCSVLCGVLLMKKKMQRQDSVPLVPFLLLGFVGRCGLI